MKYRKNLQTEINFHYCNKYSAELKQHSWGDATGKWHQRKIQASSSSSRLSVSHHCSWCVDSNCWQRRNVLCRAPIPYHKIEYRSVSLKIKQEVLKYLMIDEYFGLFESTIWMFFHNCISEFYYLLNKSNNRIKHTLIWWLQYS